MKAVIWCVLAPSLALSQSLPARAPAANHDVFPLYVKVQFDKSVRLSALKPGDVTEGNLARDVYSADRKVFPAGSHVRLTVDHLERRRRAASDRWPWVIRFFTPRHQNFPSFKDAAISVPDGPESLLQVSLISASPRTEVQAQTARKDKKEKPNKDGAATMSSESPTPSTDSTSAARRPQPSLGPVMSLEAHEEENASSAGGLDPALAPAIGPVTLPAGTACRILLLSGISASKSHAGDVVQARLLEPVVVDSHVILPAGSVFEGSVTKATPPRMLSRAGSLSLAFTSLTLPDRTRLPVSASLTGVEVNRGSHTKIDAEGRIHGDRPGVAWMLINGGITAGLAKEVDDGTQLVIEAIVSSATDASTAGTARIAGTIVSGIFMLTRHGRDVVLPNFTEMNIMLNRPLLLSAQAALNP
jgi:hypothetical protein